VKTVLVPASGKARCIACGIDLFPKEGPREVFTRFDEKTKAATLACEGCRGALPGAWAPGVVEKHGEDKLRIEPTGSAKEIVKEIAQQVISDDLQVGAGPPKTFEIRRKLVQLRALVNDAADRAKCSGGGFLILPGDLSLFADDKPVVAGEMFPGTKLKVFRDHGLLSGEAPFLRVASKESLTRARAACLILFKEPASRGVVDRQAIRVRDMVRRMTLTEEECTFILNNLYEDQPDANGSCAEPSPTESGVSEPE